MQENPDLILREGYMTDDEKLRREDPEIYEMLYKKTMYYRSPEKLLDEEKDLASEHHEKSYQYIHELLDLLEKEKCILKRPQVGKPSSYTWKHIVEHYARKINGSHTHHWVGNGLFIAVLRERNIPEKKADILNAWVPFGVKARNFCDELRLW